MRRSIRRTAPALVLGLALAACTGAGGEDPSPTAARDSASSSTAAPSTTTTAPELTGEPLVVAEQGVASFPDPFDPAATLGGYGVILQNPNPEVMATGVRVVTRILDDAGAELLVDSALLNAVLPGQRMAVGRTLIEPIEGPTRLEVVIEVSAWLLPASVDGQLVAEGVVTEPEEAGGSITRFTVRSSWPDAEDGVDVTAIYRAADGRILGAESTSLAVVPVDEPTAGQIRLLSPIPDLASTEVFVGRGFAALTVG
ncbi:MAG: hypothetical protein ABIP36_05990 [Acidimicrobiales bacterium]